MVSKARYRPQFDLWISLSNRHRRGILRSIRAPAGSSFLRTLSSRTYRKNLFVYPAWRTAVSYVHAHTEYPGIHGATERNEEEKKRTRTRDVSQIVLIFSSCGRFFQLYELNTPSIPLKRKGKRNLLLFFSPSSHRSLHSYN